MASPRKLILATLLPGLLAAGASLAADRVTIISEGSNTLWAPAPGVPQVQPGYPATARDASEDVCVSIGYQLGADGSTSDYTLLKSWGSKTSSRAKDREHLTPFAQSGIAAVMQWKFAPAGGSPAAIRPVYTAASFGFSGNPEADKEAIRQRCVISDLSDFIAKAQAEAYRRGNLLKGRIDRDRMENPPRPPAIRGVGGG